MIIQCEKCQARINVDDACFKHGPFTIVCPNCHHSIRPLPGNNKKAAPVASANASTEVKGWLVVHDERTKAQTFPLKAGKQTVGRKSEKECTIRIETTDNYMSRVHFTISVETNDHQTVFILSDAESLNHTFINTKELKEIKKNDQFYLRDGDIIQAGVTKIVFKTSELTKTDAEATRIVAAQPFGKTVWIKK